MAPEQITGGSVTPETDIFSVGAVLYELLAGRRPFVGDTLQALMYSILNKTPESLETLVSKMPRGLNEIVMRSLNKEPSQRYHSAVVMANDLAAIRTSLDPEGKRTSLSLRTAIDTALAQEHTFRSRRKLEWRAATFAAGVLLVAVVIIGGRMLLTRNSGVAPVPTPTVTPQSATQQPAPVSVSTAAAPPSALSSPAQQPTSAAGPRIAQTKTASTRESSKTTAAQPTAPPAARVDTRVPDSAPPPVVAAPHVAAAPERTPSVTQSSTPTPVVTPPASAPATALRENVAEQVNAVVAAYAHAIESLDTGELRRVYPAITAEQRHAFDDFFGSVRSLKASLSVSGLQVDGGSADAQVAGAFDYVTTSGATEHRPVRFVATLHRDRGAWTLAAVH
jgi:serine/threonine-protein kinase